MGKITHIGFNNGSIIVVCQFDVWNRDAHIMSIDEYVIVLQRNKYVKKLFSHSKGEYFIERVKSRINFYKAPEFYFSHIYALGKEIVENVRGIINISYDVSEYETQCWFTETDNTITIYWRQWSPKYLCWSLNYENWKRGKLFRYHGNADFWKDKNANLKPKPISVRAFDVLDEYLSVTLDNYFGLYCMLYSEVSSKCC